MARRVNPWRACAARVTVLGLCVSVCLLLTLGVHVRGLRHLVGVCVCVSGTMSPATTRNGASNQRYLRLQRNLKNILNMAFSPKMLCAKVMV